MKTRVLEVSELNNFIRGIIINDPILSNISLRGEVSNLKVHSSGNIYLSLKDEDSKINCVIMKRYIDKKVELKDGQKLVVEGEVNVYLRDGSYQLYIKKFQEEGLGDLYLKYIKLKEKLETEGLFDVRHKRQIPKFPKNIGVITSRTGSVIKDIINVVTRRFPKIGIKLYPVLVQGEHSASSLIKALDFFDKNKCVDTIIIGRGGGSLEELFSFNDEEVARKIFSMTTPIISAVGHETDFTICDFVSDMRAPTPSAAAEIATPNLSDLINLNRNILNRISNSISNKLDLERHKVDGIMDKYIIYVEKYMIADRYVEIDRYQERLEVSIKRLLSEKKKEISILGAKMGNLNPLSVLSRGYSLAEKDGSLINSVDNIKKDDRIDVLLDDGRLFCRVEDIEQNSENI